MTRSACLSLLFTLFGACFVACDDGAQTGIDGKASWLGHCRKDAECGSGLECKCGLCTKTCSQTADCGALSAQAVCAEPATRSIACSDVPAPEQICLLKCESSGDCSAGYSCKAGVCAPASERDDGGSMDAGTPVPRTDASRLDGNNGTSDAASHPDEKNNAGDAAPDPGGKDNASDAAPDWGSKNNASDAALGPGTVSDAASNPGAVSDAARDPGAASDASDAGSAGQDGAVEALDARPPVGCPDGDGDGICDAVDVCPGFDDRIDTDGDGRPDGCEPRLLADVNTATADSSPANFAVLGDSVYFTATDGVPDHGVRLWKMDAPGTQATVSDLPVSNPVSVTAAGNRLFIVTGDTDDRTLIASDGTPAGTNVVASELWSLTATWGTSKLFYFVAAGNKESLWRSDGTPEGTFKLVEPDAFATQIGGGYRAEWIESEGLLFFTARTPGYSEVWRTDGTVAGTFTVTPGGEPRIHGGYDRGTYATLGGRVYFNVEAGATEAGTWSTDGTIAGTHPAFSHPPAGLYPSGIAATGTHLFIAAPLPSFPSATPAVWTSTGDGEAPTQLADGPTYVQSFAIAGEVAYISGEWLWQSDGTGAPAKMIFPLSAPAAKLITLGDSAYNPFGDSLYRIDGTGETVLASGLHVSPVTDQDKWAAVGNRLFFVAETDAHGVEPWVTDGTPEGTHEVADINPATLDSEATSFASGTSAGSPVVFVAKRASSKLQPFITRGSAQTTKPLLPGNPLTDVKKWLTIGDRQFFVGQDSTSRPVVFRVEDDDSVLTIDPPPWDDLAIAPAYADRSRVYFGGTSELKSIPVDHLIGESPTLSPTDGSLLSFARVGVPTALLEWKGETYLAAGAVWKTNGSHLTAVGSYASGPLVVAGQWLYFLGQGPYGYANAYRTDGTDGGTMPISAINQAFYEMVDSLLDVAYQENVYFGSWGRGLYRSDGSNAVPVGPIDTRSLGILLGDKLIVLEKHGVWCSDGTTPALRNLTNPTSSDVRPTGAAVYHGLVYFAGYDAEHGTELWRTDGTSAGTFMEADISPGAASSSPHDFRATNDALYFVATTPEVGDEPRIMRH